MATTTTPVPSQNTSFTQAFGPLAEIDGLCRLRDPDYACRTDHNPAFNAPSTAAMVVGEAPLSIVTRAPATAILMAAARRCRPRRFGRDDGAEGSDGGGWLSGATTAGTKAGIISLTLRASRRKINRCCGVRPWRRATALTVTSGSKLSAMAVPEQERRSLVYVLGDRRHHAPLPNQSLNKNCNPLQRTRWIVSQQVV